MELCQMSALIHKVSDRVVYGCVPRHYNIITILIIHENAMRNSISGSLGEIEEDIH